MDSTSANATRTMMNRSRLLLTVVVVVSLGAQLGCNPRKSSDSTTVASSPSKESMPCPAERELECIRVRFRELLSTHPNYLWTTLSDIVEEVAQCKSRQQVTEFFSLYGWTVHSKRLNELFDETLDKLCAQQPECMLKAMRLMEDSSIRQTIAIIMRADMNTDSPSCIPPEYRGEVCPNNDLGCYADKFTMVYSYKDPGALWDVMYKELDEASIAASACKDTGEIREIFMLGRPSKINAEFSSFMAEAIHRLVRESPACSIEVLMSLPEPDRNYMINFMAEIPVVPEYEDRPPLPDVLAPLRDDPKYADFFELYNRN